MQRNKKSKAFLKKIFIFWGMMVLVLIYELYQSPISETAKFTKPTTLEIVREYPLGIKTTSKLRVANYYKDIVKVPRKRLQEVYYYMIVIKDDQNKKYPLTLTPFCVAKTDDIYCQDLEYEYNNIDIFFHSNTKEYIVNNYADSVDAFLALYLIGGIFIYINLRLFILNKRNLNKLLNRRSE